MKTYSKLLHKFIFVSLIVNILSRVTDMSEIIIIPTEQRTVYTLVHAYFRKYFHSLDVMYYQFILILQIICNMSGLMLIAFVAQFHVFVSAPFSLSTLL
jgi:hypothetical protein